MTYDWLTEITVPLNVLYSDNTASRCAFPMQDMLHDIKKLRNEMKLTENRCLLVGIDIDR